MIIREMRFDQLQKFQRCLIDNGDNTFSIRVTPGSSSGINSRAFKRSDIMKSFDKTISQDSVRVA